MSENVQVSVVIPVYTAAARVASAVRSALASDLRELEVVLVDNSSTNHSVTIGADIRDSRVVSVRLRPGGGAARARNVGIARARGTYVAFLEPDDLLGPSKLSATARALDRYPAAGFAFADFEQLDAGGAVVRPSAIADFPRFRALATVPVEADWHLIAQEQLARGLVYEDFIETSGVVVRKKLLTEVGPFDESTISSEDLDLWFRLAHHCDALYWDHIGHTCRTVLAPAGAETHAHTDARIIVLRREQNRWNDRAVRRHLARRVAENLAMMGDEERVYRHRLRAATLFAYAFATFPDVRWLRGMLGSLLLRLGVAREN